MTTAERVQAAADYGFTERQARFLVLVMRHAGLCLKRQYAAFAGIANGGEKCNAFFDKLVRRGFAVASDCIHNRARIYHVHHKPLYQAMGEPDSRFRRAVPARSAAGRLMRLDAGLIMRISSGSRHGRRSWRGCTRGRHRRPVTDVKTWQFP
jgi:hypothetical protein